MGTLGEDASDHGSEAEEILTEFQAQFLGRTFEDMDPLVVRGAMAHLIAKLGVGLGSLSDTDRLLRGFLVDSNLGTKSDQDIWTFARSRECKSLLIELRNIAHTLDPRSPLIDTLVGVASAVQLCRACDLEDSKDGIGGLRLLLPAMAYDLLIDKLIDELGAKIAEFEGQFSQILSAGSGAPGSGKFRDIN